MISRRDLLLLGSLGFVEACAANAGSKVDAVHHELKLLAEVPRPKYLTLPRTAPQVFRSKGDLVLTETFPHNNGGYTLVNVRLPYRPKLNDELKIQDFRWEDEEDVSLVTYPHFQVESFRNPYCAVIALTGFDKGPTGLVHKIKVQSKSRVGLSTGKYKTSEFYRCVSKIDSDICKMANPKEGQVGIVERILYLTHTRPATGDDQKNISRLFKAVRKLYEPRLAVLMTQEDGVVVGKRKTTSVDVKSLDEMLYLSMRV